MSERTASYGALILPRAVRASFVFVFLFALLLTARKDFLDLRARQSL